MQRSRRLIVSLLAGPLALALLRAPAARADRDEPEESAPPPGMKARVFQVKHQDPENLVEVLRPLTSGRPGAMLRDNDRLRTVTVRDFPENLAAIEQALRRLDQPTPRKPDVELRVHLLLGSPGSASGQLPPELAPVVKQLQTTLSYRSYHHVASVAQRVRAGSGASGKGQVLLNPPAVESAATGQFRYKVENLALPQTGAGGAAQVNLKRFSLELDGGALGTAEVSTGLTLRDGEKVVVGTGSLKNRALIVVLTAQLLP